METILLMLSGGIDSTYLLYHYLTQTNHPVHVHHISLRYPQFQRWKMEDPAVQDIISHCLSAYREFSYSESRFDIDSLRHVGSDQALQLLVASKVGPNLPAKKVTLALGHCLDDFDTPEARDRLRQRTMPRMWAALIESGNEGERMNPDIAKPMVDLKLTKKEICRKLPDELLKICWSCRMPHFIGEQGLPCGNCNTCTKIESIFRQFGTADKFPNLVRRRNMKTPVVDLDPGMGGARFFPSQPHTSQSPPPPVHNPDIRRSPARPAKRLESDQAVKPPHGSRSFPN